MLEVAIEKRLRDFELRTAFSADDELIVLFGPSGAGKSVTVRSIAGIITPDAGSIKIDGRPVFDASRGIDVPIQKRHVGYVPQHYGLFPHLSVGENVAYGLAGIPADRARARVSDMLGRLDLAGYERRRPRELSGGQQQRVALARALITEPRVLLLDEPFSALDSMLRARLRRDLLTIHRQFPVTTIFISHDLGEAYTLADKIAVYDRGSVLQVGSRDDIFRRPASGRVARLTGASNVFPARLVARAEPHGRGVACDEPERGHGLRVQLAGTDSILAAEDPGGLLQASVSICIRPEAIVVEDLSTADRPNRIRARVLDHVPGATSVTLFCEASASLAGQGRIEFEAVIPAERFRILKLANGAECVLHLPPADLFVLPDDESNG
ncbi:MAG TPA: ABC transporter ATP-binding protein [Chloroflexota bacterium]|nr:ABC transporter ATP-binding protein [Chloroflexota bacterium]